MFFMSAYDLELAVGQEIVFVRQDDGHRKVRLLITELQIQDEAATFSGHSFGSSVREIKAAKKDETPVVVRGNVTLDGNRWVGELVVD